MIRKWKAKNALTIDERHLIKDAIDNGMTYSEMAKFVGRHKSTVMREAKRLGHYLLYDPEKAQKDFEEKQKLIGFKRK